MPVSEQDYRKAVAAVKGGTAPDDVVDGLMDIIDEYEHAKPQASPAMSSSPTSFGEGGSILGTGPTGMDVLSKEIRPAEEHEDIQKSFAVDPKIADALRLPEVQKRMPLATDSRLAEQRERIRIEGEQNAQRYDNALPTASKRKDAHLSAPPEFIPEQAPATGATNPFDAFSMSMDKARSNLPAFAGGKVEPYLEPPLEQFRRDMAPTLGDSVLGMGLGDDAYIEYADQLWTKLYNEAKAEGRHIVRVAYKDTKNWNDVVTKYGAETIGAVAGAARGVDEGAFGGMVSRIAAGGDEEQLANYKRMGEGSPLARLGGQIVGGGSKIGLGGLTSRGLGSVLPEAGGIWSGAARGGAQAMGAGAASTTSLAAAEDRAPSMGELGLGAGLALPFGLVGGAHGHSLRESTPLEQVEKSGMGETSLWSGVRKSYRADAVGKEARAATGQPGREVDYMTKNLEEPLATAGRRLEKGTEKSLGAIKEGYFNATKNDEKPISSFLNDAMELRKGLTTADGRPIPQKGPQIKYLDKLIVDSANVEVVPTAGGKALVRASRPGTVDMTLEEAERAGINTTQAMRGYQASKGQPISADLGPDVQTSIPGETDVMIRVTPRELNAEALEKMKGQLDLEMGFGENPHKEELSSLLRSAREARDTFPAKGPIPKGLTATVDTGTEKIQLKDFSASQRLAGEKTAAVKRTLGHAGLPEHVPEKLSAAEAETFQGRIQGYKQVGRSTDVDDALRELAGLADKGNDLEALAGMRGLKELKPGFPTSRAGLLQAGRLRLDPLLQFLGPGAAAAAPGGARRLSGHQKLPPQLDPATLEKYMNLMGPPGGPFF